MNRKLLVISLLCIGLFSCSPKNEPSVSGGGDEPSATCDGSFSVSDSKKVIFAPGNLQYKVSTNTWRFASHQYDFVGQGAYGNVEEGGIKSSYDGIEDDYYDDCTYAGWCDMFNWSVSTNRYGTTVFSYEDKDEKYWGDTIFSNWGKVMGAEWFMLTKSEWNYVLNLRKNARQLIAVGCVNDVTGLILLPDNYSIPSGINFNSGLKESATILEADIIAAYKQHNSYNLSQWKQLEDDGAVFLPATELYGMQTQGRYWSRTICLDASSGDHLCDAYAVWFMNSMLWITNNGRNCSSAVRLVKLHK